MARDHSFDNRKFVIGGIAVGIILIYIIRLFSLQMFSDDYKKSADSNAFLKRVQYPARGAITDRNGDLLVYNQPAYDTATRQFAVQWTWCWHEEVHFDAS